MNQKLVTRFKKVLTEHQGKIKTWLATSPASAETCVLENKTVVDRDASNNVLQEIDGALERVLAVTEKDGSKSVSDPVEVDFSRCISLKEFTEDEMRELQRDLNLAAKVQRNMMPCCVPELTGYEVAAYTQQSGIVGGDYYDFFVDPDQKQGFIVADVMGKGLPASMMMSNLQASVRILGGIHKALDEIARYLNSNFRANLKMNSFISVFLARICEQDRELRYTNAGHHPAALWKSTERAVTWLKPTGPAIGLMADAAYETCTVPLAKGDLLVMYTDGLTEARNEEGFELGEAGLAKLIERFADLPADQFKEKILESASAYCNGKFSDDVTVVAVRVL